MTHPWKYNECPLQNFSLNHEMRSQIFTPYSAKSCPILKLYAPAESLWKKLHNWVCNCTRRNRLYFVLVRSFKQQYFALLVLVQSCYFHETTDYCAQNSLMQQVRSQFCAFIAHHVHILPDSITTFIAWWQQRWQTALSQEDGNPTTSKRIWILVMYRGKADSQTKTYM